MWWLARNHRIHRTANELRVTTHHQGIWAQLSASLMSAANHHAFYLTRNKASEAGVAEPDQQLSKLTSLIGKVHIASRVLSFPQLCRREHYYFFLGHVAAVRGNRCWKNESFQNWLAFDDVRNTFLPNVRIRLPRNETSCPRRTEILRYSIQKNVSLLWLQFC